MAGRSRPNSRRRAAQRRSLMKRFGPFCARCGRAGKLTLDHVVPRSKGGRNAISNLQLLCDECNQAKADSANATSAIFEGAA